MDWQERMQRAIDRLEQNLTGTADLEGAAREANCSPFHFFRMFEVITGMGPGEYLRRRRLSEAALDLCRGDERVIDVAMRYGYESPDSFARAFRREFGCLPSEARKEGARLHRYPKLSFSIVLKGDKAMEYRIEERPAMLLVGISRTVESQGGQNFKEIPLFWQEVMQDGRFEALARQASWQGVGVCAVCHEHDMASGRFTYSIAVDKPSDLAGLPAGSRDIAIPAALWGRFTSRGALPTALQQTIQRIYTEWLPASGYEHAGIAEIEYYPQGDTQSPDYVCEYWIPLKRPG